MRAHPLCAACLLLLLTACSETTPAELPQTPAFSFMNGPAELLNVDRFESRWFKVIADDVSGLVAVANFPDDPRTRVFCAGSARPDFLPMQRVGWIQDVINALTNAGDVNIHVYRTSDVPDEASYCTAMWIAKGTGRLMYNDNDRQFSQTRADTWSFRINGTVEMVDGSGTKQLDAQEHLIVVNGVGYVLSRRVALN